MTGHEIDVALDIDTPGVTSVAGFRLSGRSAERVYLSAGGDAGGVSSWRATRRALLRMARVALPMLIDARETASMSLPTLNGSRMSLPTNCAANAFVSTEKYP